MSKSYKKEVLQLLRKYPNTIVNINSKDIPVYSYNLQELSNINLEDILKKEKLSGKTFPVAIVQYNTFIPWTNNVGPMIAFIWSWGGPWAFIYNVQFPDCSESGSVPLHRLTEFEGQLPSNYFNMVG